MQTIDYKFTHASRVDSQFARLSLGALWLEEIFEMFDVPLSNASTKLING